MTAQLIEQIEALVAKATPANWRTSAASMDGFGPIMAPGGVIVALLSKLSGNAAADADLIVLLCNSVPTILAALREVETLREAGRHIMPYLKWTISPESPGHHPTMPSAVGAFEQALSKETNDG